MTKDVMASEMAALLVDLNLLLNFLLNDNLKPCFTPKLSISSGEGIKDRCMSLVIHLHWLNGTVEIHPKERERERERMELSKEKKKRKLIAYRKTYQKSENTLNNFRLIYICLLQTWTGNQGWIRCLLCILQLQASARSFWTWPLTFFFSFLE